jgi:hypothetical protein
VYVSVREIERERERERESVCVCVRLRAYTLQSVGVVMQSLCGAVRDELARFNTYVASLQSQLAYDACVHACVR